MSPINLYQESSQEAEKKNTSILSTGLAFSLVILLLVLLAWGGLKIANASLEKSNATVEKNITVAKNGIQGEQDINKIADFQNRTSKIRKTIAGTIGMKQLVQDVANEIIPGIRLTSYTYDSGKLTLNFSADNYQLVAKQIVNFKKSVNFSRVNVVNISRGEKTIDFSLDMINTKKAK